MTIKALVSDGSTLGPPYTTDDIALLMGIYTGAYWSIDAGVVAGADNELSATISGPQLLVGTGRAVVNGYPYINDEELALTPDRPLLGTTTKWLVVEVIWDGETVNDVKCNTVIVEGTDGTGGALALQQQPGDIYQIPLWSFEVDVNGTISNLTDIRVFTKNPFPYPSLHDPANATSSVTVPKTMVAWAVVDIVSGDSPTVIDTFGPIEVYENYLDDSTSGTNRNFYIALSVTGDASDLTLTGSATFIGKTTDSGLTVPNSFTWGAQSLDPPGSLWDIGVLVATSTNNLVTAGPDNTASINDDLGKWLLTAWASQP